MFFPATAIYCGKETQRERQANFKETPFHCRTVSRTAISVLFSLEAKIDSLEVRIEKGVGRCACKSSFSTVEVREAKKVVQDCSWTASGFSIDLVRLFSDRFGSLRRVKFGLTYEGFNRVREGFNRVPEGFNKVSEGFNNVP